MPIFCFRGGGGPCSVPLWWCFANTVFPLCAMWSQLPWLPLALSHVCCRWSSGRRGSSSWWSWVFSLPSAFLSAVPFSSLVGCVANSAAAASGRRRASTPTACPSPSPSSLFSLPVVSCEWGTCILCQSHTCTTKCIQTCVWPDLGNWPGFQKDYFKNKSLNGWNAIFFSKTIKLDL